MTSTVETFFALVRDRYDAGLLAAGVDPGPNVTKGPSEGQPSGFVDLRGDWLFGPQHVSSERATQKRPKVVLVVPDDGYETISKGAVTVRPAPVGEKRAVYNRRSQLIWHVWGANRGVVEEVSTNIVVCQLRALPAGSGSNGTFVPKGTRWIHDEQTDAKSAGSYAVMTCELVHRLNDELTVRATVAAAALTHTATFGNQETC